MIYGEVGTTVTVSGSDTLVSNWLMAVPMTIRLGTHVSPTITSDPVTLHVCKQQIVSGNKLLLVILIVVLITIRLGTHMPRPLTINSDATTFHPCNQQQIASGNKIVISDTLVSNCLIVYSVNDSKTWYTYVSHHYVTLMFTTLHVCKQQQIASGNKLLLVIH